MKAAKPDYAEVAVGLPLLTTFHYRIPEGLKPKAAPGKRVRISFGQRQLLGIQVGFAKRPDVANLKPLLEILDDEPLLEEELLKLTRWMAQTYQTGWGQTLAAALPAPLRRGKDVIHPRTVEAPLEVIATDRQRLTEEQQEAFEKIRSCLQKPLHEVFLLHGVTGSGKTEVYLQAIHELLLQGRSSIVLVPEISLTPQAIERFQGRFGRDRIAVLHSGQLESQRLQEWWRIRSGEARIVVGARSAIFAPVKSLGLIVIDEEHEPSYKQEDSPRYHAREVAIERGKLAGVPVVLGSATPSLESYEKAKRGLYQLLELTHRIDRVPLPRVDIVDMREEVELRRGVNIFSRLLLELLTETLSSRQQAILFLNRRGFATSVACRSCGLALRCPSCQVTLTYHMEKKQLLCHYCQASQPLPEICPQCRSEYVRFQGTGTQKVESELARHVPQAKVVRMDTDATRSRGSHAKILKSFRDREIDILVGTQMVAKGLDFPQVTLVGVISADTALNLPDFRSAERTFHLLTQVAGRAGRGSLPGRVVVQTFAPHHYAIAAASRHDYKEFYAKEIAIRRQLKLPPFSRLIQLTVRARAESKGLEEAKEIVRILQQKFSSKVEPRGRNPEQGPAAESRGPRRRVEVSGPSPAPIFRMRRHYYWNVLLKSKTLEAMQSGLYDMLKTHRVGRGCRLIVDVDPM